jgi:citrate lyase synthetase
MINYNNTLKNILLDKLVVIDRIKLDDEIISASKVRELLKSDQLEEALKYIPREIHILIKSYVVNNYGNA